MSDFGKTALISDRLLAPLYLLIKTAFSPHLTGIARGLSEMESSLIGSYRRLSSAPNGCSEVHHKVTTFGCPKKTVLQSKNGMRKRPENPGAFRMETQFASGVSGAWKQHSGGDQGLNVAGQEPR